jgi:L-lactate utilization protein LutC
MEYNKIPSDETIRLAIAALEKNGMKALVVKTGAEAKAKVSELIPEGAEVMNMTSITLDTIGAAQEINESGKYDSVKNKLAAMDRETQGRQMQQIGAAPQYAVGSVHAVTENGEVVIASQTGSQLPAYAYGAEKVIWVVGAQKIVPDMDAAIKRIYEYVLPLEGERANKAYGITTGSAVNKMLTVNHEKIEGRITIIFVKEVLGF